MTVIAEKEVMELHGYPVMLRPLSEDEGGGFLAEVPDLPGCMGDGETPEEAFASARDAIAEWIDEAERLGRPIPQPSDPSAYSGKWLQRVPKSLHARLAEQAKREGVSLNQFVATVLAEGIGKRSVAA